MKQTKSLKLDSEKIKEKTHRTSLMLALTIFVFAILLSAILISGFVVWALTKVGILLDGYGELRLSSIFLFMLISSLVISATIAFFSSRIPLKPVNDLVNKMNRLAAGDFKTRLKFGPMISTHHVFKEITASFNTMAEELENTELLRNDFINNFSHEFKTPIVSIAGFAGLLEKGDLTEEQRQLYLRSIREESMRLSEMATNVLNLTKVENQRILTDISRFDLSEQIRSAVLLFENKWVEKDIEIQLDFDEFMIEANEELLKQIWINLIDNAVKFVPRGGTVKVDISETTDMLSVAIGNTGNEIPREKQAKIFEKFYQADESHATYGNGIGLAIVKRITELHGGRVGVTSESGLTTFYVELPKKQKRIRTTSRGNR